MKSFKRIVVGVCFPLLAACAVVDAPQDPADLPLEGAVQNPSSDFAVPGYVHAFERSRFRLGQLLNVAQERGMVKLIGTEGTFAVAAQTGEVNAIPNSDAPALSEGPFTDSASEHHAEALEYFERAGIPMDQVADIHVSTLMAGRGNSTDGSRDPRESAHLEAYYSQLVRAVAGVPVVDSRAWVRFNESGDAVSESVLWPELPSRVVVEAKRFQRQMADKVLFGAFHRQLGVGEQTGEVVIHHGWSAREGRVISLASYDVNVRLSGGASVLRHFDAGGLELTLPWQAQEEQDPAERLELETTLEGLKASVELQTMVGGLDIDQPARGRAESIAPAASPTYGTGVNVFSVDKYGSKGDLYNRVTNGNGFLTEITRSTYWTRGAVYTNSAVYDVDFVDPERAGTGNGTDNLNFDTASGGISFFSGHGVCDGGTSQTCTTSSQCNSPASGQRLPGACRTAPGMAGLCHYVTDRYIVTNGGGDKYGGWVDYSNGYVKWGESTQSGTWGGAGSNGGTNLAVLDLSCGVVPPFWVEQLKPSFAGLHMLATIMPTNGDTADVPDRGATFARRWSANPGGSVAQAWMETLNNLPYNEGGSCYTSDYSYGGGHGINGCGANFAISFDTSAAAANWHMYTETWASNGLANNGYDPKGNSYYY